MHSYDQRVLPPGEYDRIYQQGSCVLSDVIMSRGAMSLFAKLLWPLLLQQNITTNTSIITVRNKLAGSFINRNRV